MFVPFVHLNPLQHTQTQFRMLFGVIRKPFERTNHAVIIVFFRFNMKMNYCVRNSTKILPFTRFFRKLVYHTLQNSYYVFFIK